MNDRGGISVNTFRLLFQWFAKFRLHWPNSISYQFIAHASLVSVKLTISRGITQDKLCSRVFALSDRCLLAAV